jgi:hypothetical protein
MFGCQWGRHGVVTKFRFGALAGFAVGYYLGARAGRERYEQMNSVLRRARSSPTFDQAATVVGKAKAVVDLTRERVVDVTEQKTDVSRP